MTITNIAKKMGAKPEEYLTYIRQIHPLENKKNMKSQEQRTLSNAIQRYHGYSDTHKT